MNPQSIVRNDGAHLHLSTTKADEIPALQGHLLEWCRVKIKALQEELKDFRTCRQIAEKRKHAMGPFLRGIARTQGRLKFHQKIAAALQQGYCLFPPIRGADVFAVRTRSKRPSSETSERSWHRFEVSPAALAVGEGRFISNEPEIWQRDIPDEKDRTKTVKQYYAKAFKEVEFPVQLIKPELMEAAGKALDEKIFDELAVVTGRDDDPVLIGNILRPNKARLSFFLAWFLDTRRL